MAKKTTLDPTWRYESRAIPYNEGGELLETFIKNLRKSGEGLTDPQVTISSHGDREYDGYSYVELSITGTRPKTEQELEREREAVEWQKKRETDAKKARVQAEKTLFLSLYKKYGKPKEE